MDKAPIGTRAGDIGGWVGLGCLFVGIALSLSGLYHPVVAVGIGAAVGAGTGIVLWLLIGRRAGRAAGPGRGTNGD